jgi:splicing factor 3B subunit 4
MHMVKLYSKPIKVNKASQDKRTQEVGANLFIGNLDPEVDEKMLYETFSNFGLIISTKITRDVEDGTSKGYGFVSYDNFESSDIAIQQMNNQYFSGRQITVQYALKKDTKGERHGGAAERLLAANKPTTTSKMPTLFRPPGLA